jgi:hypothetical protein
MFTTNNFPSMENYMIFSPGVVGLLKSLIVNEMFNIWFINLKKEFHRWRIKKIVHRELTEHHNIYIIIDTTKFLCGVKSAPVPKDLDYLPIQLQIFEVLVIQIL